MEVKGLERSVLVAIAASIGANVFLYGSTTMLIDSVQTTIWLLFWAGIASYLIAFGSARASAPSRDFVALPAMLQQQGDLA